jgi:hypothetical protein
MQAKLLSLLGSTLKPKFLTCSLASYFLKLAQYSSLSLAMRLARLAQFFGKAWMVGYKVEDVDPFIEKEV